MKEVYGRNSLYPSTSNLTRRLLYSVETAFDCSRSLRQAPGMLLVILSTSGALVARPSGTLSVRPRHGITQYGTRAVVEGAGRRVCAAMQLEDETAPLPVGEPVLVGDRLQVFIDTEEEEGSVWAAATVDSIDASSREFMVMVTQWDRLDPEDDRYAEAYEEGPYTAAEEGEEWRRARRRPQKTLAGFAAFAMRGAKRRANEILESIEAVEEQEPR